MNLILLILVSFILSLVPFSVALNSSIYRCIRWNEALRIALVFAFFQVAMMSIGWIIGFSMKGLFYNLKVPMAVLIILFIAVRMLADSRRPGKENRIMAVENRRILIGFAFVISINTAMLSTGLGILYMEILLLTGFIFGFVFLLTIAGVQAGKLGMMGFGKTAETIGGVGLFLFCGVVILQYLKIL